MVEQKIKWCGQIADIKPFLAASDIGLSASTEEGFSNAILEYMAAKLAIIATAVGGTPEAIQRGESGMLVPPSDPTAFAGALEKLVMSENLRNVLGHNARARVKEKFSIERVIEGYATTYRGLLEPEYEHRS